MPAPDTMARCGPLAWLAALATVSSVAAVLSVTLAPGDSVSVHCVAASRVTPPQAGRVEPCTRAMFGNKSAVALLACEAQFALQRNWYPDPIQVAAAWLP